MIGFTRLRELRGLVSPALLSISDVAGVGVAGGSLAVYLARDSVSVRKQVMDIVKSIDPDATVSFTYAEPIRPLFSSSGPEGPGE